MGVPHCASHCLIQLPNTANRVVYLATPINVEVTGIKRLFAVNASTTAITKGVAANVSITITYGAEVIVVLVSFNFAVSAFVAAG